MHLNIYSTYEAKEKLKLQYLGKAKGSFVRLEHMWWPGKAQYFALGLVPCVLISTAVFYSPDTYKTMF